jgi:hypothetical protein
MRKLTLLLAAALLVCAPALASAARTTPQGFIGLHMEDPSVMAADGVSIENELARAAANGVESIRFPVYWSKVQPYGSTAAVPVSKAGNFTEDPAGGAPFDFTLLDRFVLAAASNRINLVPTLMGAPSWAADRAYPTSNTGINPLHMPIPADFSQFGHFAAALAARYGTAGSFWTANPSVKPTPITTWQIWNEPNFSYYWPQHLGETQTVTVLVKNKPTVKSLPNLYFAPTYIGLLKASRTAIRAVNPKAKIMIASMANSDRATRTPPSDQWVDLSFVYQAGGKGLFDVVAANLFTGSPTHLLGYLGWYRKAMKTGGDAKLPVTITEMSWSGSLGSIPDSNKMYSLVVSPAVQASNLAKALTTFAGAQKSALVTGAYWHTWDTGYSDNTDIWDWTGLVKRTPGSSAVAALPLLTAYKNAAFKLQGACKRKVVATDCLKK